MRKFTAIFSLIVFGNSFFCYTYFSFSVAKARFEAAKSIAGAEAGVQAGILRVNGVNIQKDESDEVWYRDKLYDVVRRERTGDTVYVYILPDEEEQNILSKGTGYFQNESGGLSTTYNHLGSVVKFQSGNQQAYIIPRLPELDTILEAAGVPTLHVKVLVTKLSVTVPTPPPEC